MSTPHRDPWVGRVDYRQALSRSCSRKEAMKILHRLSTEKMHTSRETHELWVQTPANLRPRRVHPADAAACQLLRVLHLRMFRISLPV